MTSRVKAGKSAPKLVNSSLNWGMTNNMMTAVLLASLDQVAEEIVELQRMLGQGDGEGGPALDVILHRQDQVRHGRVVMTAANDIEGLHQRYTGGHHGGELATEDRDVLADDLLFTPHPGLFADLRRCDALPAQFGADRGLIGGWGFTAEPLAGAVNAFPGEEQVFVRLGLIGRPGLGGGIGFFGGNQGHD